MLKKLQACCVVTVILAIILFEVSLEPSFAHDVDGCSVDSAYDYAEMTGQFWLLPIIYYYGDLFEGQCNTHDNCYHHGYATYNYERDFCDSQILDNLNAKCDDYYCDCEWYEPWCYVSCAYNDPICRAAALVFYESIHNSDEGRASFLVPGTCNNYLGATPDPCPRTIETDWIVEHDYTMNSDTTVYGNVEVVNGALLTISSGATLSVNLINKHIKVQHGSGILVKAGGKIQ